MEVKIDWGGPDGMLFVAQTGTGHIAAMDGAPDGGGHNRGSARLRLDGDEPEGLGVRRDDGDVGGSVPIDEHRPIAGRLESNDIGDPELGGEIDKRGRVL